MHVHLPKPLHGWREFIGEVGIIVVGVLIALGAEQFVHHINQGLDGERAFRAIKVELGHAGGVFDERVAMQPCLDKRLATITAIISGVRRTHILPAIGEIGRPASRPTQSAAWSSAVSKGLVETFPEDKQDQLSIIASQLERSGNRIEDEQILWARLRVIEDQPGPIDPAQLAQVVTLLRELAYRSRLNGIIAAQESDNLRALGIKSDFIFMENPGMSVDRAAMLANVKQRPVCKPLMVDGNAL